MEHTHSFSPLETLVVMELETLRLEQEQLGKDFPLLQFSQNVEARESFLHRMEGLRSRSLRLQRLLDGMAFCGFEECEPDFLPEPSPLRRTAA